MTRQHGRAASHETAPLGIKIFCFIAGLAALVGVLFTFRLFTLGGPGPALGFIFLGLLAAYGYVLYGLWTLEPWAWAWGLALFAVDMVIDLFSGDPFGALISVVLFIYLWSKQEYYKNSEATNRRSTLG